MDKFTEFMRLHRAINGLTQEMLAEKMKYYQSAIGHWEQNRSSPDLKNIKKLSEIFNVPIAEIVELLIDRKHDVF